MFTVNGCFIEVATVESHIRENCMEESLLEKKDLSKNLIKNKLRIKQEDAHLHVDICKVVKLFQGIRQDSVSFKSTISLV